MKDHDRENVEVTRDARVASARVLPKNMCAPRDDSCTLSYDQLTDLTTNPAHWPNHGPENHKFASLQTLALLHTKGKWDGLSKAWMAMLVNQGCTS